MTYETEIFKDDIYICKDCDNPLYMHNRFDAYFCPECNVWKEQECGDPDCRFCKDRPARPMS